MKKLFLSVILTSFVITSIFANDALSNLSEQQIKTLFCHKWKLNYLEFKGKRKEIPSSLPESILVFLNDGKLEQYEGKTKYTGTWTYNHSTKTITTIDKDGTEKYIIEEVGNELFVMSSKIKGFEFKMGLKKTS